MQAITIGSLDELVAARLRRTGTTRAELSNIVGVSPNTLNAKIIGASEFSLGEAKSLSDWLDVPIQELCELLFDHNT